MRMMLAIASDYSVRNIGPIENGPRGTDQTLAAIWGVVKTACDDSSVKRTAAMLQTPERLYDWCRAHVEFMADPPAVELVRTPASAIRSIRSTGVFKGDCDDLATLGASLLRCMGYTPGLCVSGKPRSDRPRGFQHILFGFFASSRAKYPNAIQHPEGIKAGKPFFVPMDPQEKRPIGHKIPEGYRRISIATGAHA